MRGRWASAAIGAGIARNRAQGQAQQEIQAANQASQMEMERMKAQHQHEIDQLKAAQHRHHLSSQQKILWQS